LNHKINYKIIKLSIALTLAFITAIFGTAISDAAENENVSASSEQVGSIMENSSDNSSVIDDVSCSHEHKTLTNTIPATCQTTGTREWICKDCGEVFTQTIRMTPHNYVKYRVIKPTYYKDGYTLYKCSMCGKAVRRDITPKIETINMSDCTITLSRTGFKQTGYTQRPEVMVEFDSRLLVQDKDYTVSYSDDRCIDPGTYYVIVTGINKYTGTVRKKYGIISAKKAVDTVKMNKMSANICVGQTFILSPTIIPATADKTLKWSSDNESVAVVENGKVTGLKAGFAVITAEGNTGKYSNCFVTVTTAPTSLKLSRTSLTMGIGESYSLKAITTPSQADKSCTWMSTDTSVAIAVNGRVTAKRSGTARIIVKTGNGITAGCDVTVKPAAQSVSLNVSSITLNVGQKYQLSASIPANTASVSKTFSSANPSIVSVANSSNGMIEAKKAGSTTVTVKLNNGKKASCTVYVR